MRALTSVYIRENEGERRILSREICIVFFADVLMSLMSNFLAKHLVRSVWTTCTANALRITDADAPE